jgi:3-hydroxybutyrate dehydrogenase
MTPLLNHRTVWISGAAGGIGLVMARTFAQEGARVVIADLHAGAVQQAAEQLQSEGYEVLPSVCDVTKEEQIQESIDNTLQQFGTIDIVVNNAGMQSVHLVEEFPTDKFEQMIKIMLTAPFIVTKQVFPTMKKQQYGRIINMSSINGLIGFAGKAAYNSAKHGLIGLTKVTALEGAAFGITVNALCPGYTNTPLVAGQLQDIAATRKIPLEKVLEEVLYPIIPQKRLLEVQEIADYAVFLASEKAKGVTGQAVVIDGGYTVQ